MSNLGKKQFKSDSNLFQKDKFQKKNPSKESNTHFDILENDSKLNRILRVKTSRVSILKKVNRIDFYILKKGKQIGSAQKAIHTIGFLFQSLDNEFKA